MPPLPRHTTITHCFDRSTSPSKHYVPPSSIDSSCSTATARSCVAVLCVDELGLGVDPVVSVRTGPSTMDLVHVNFNNSTRDAASVATFEMQDLRVVNMSLCKLLGGLMARKLTVKRLIYLFGWRWCFSSGRCRPEKAVNYQLTMSKVVAELTVAIAKEKTRGELRAIVKEYVCPGWMKNWSMIGSKRRWTVLNGMTTSKVL